MISDFLSGRIYYRIGDGIEVHKLASKKLGDKI